MKRVESLVLTSLVFLAIADLNFANAQARNAAQQAAQAGAGRMCPVEIRSIESA